MATVKPQVNLAKPAAQAKPAKKTSSGPRSAGVLFTKENHKWMMIGGALMVLGFIAMAGGKSVDPTQFKPADVYSPMRITIAPLLVLLGLGTLVFAIMKKPAEAGNQA
jgi:Protein of unknown function (DUF3098)